MCPIRVNTVGTLNRHVLKATVIYIYRTSCRYIMASRFTIYSINQISDLIHQISYIIYKISDILYQISYINKISYI